MKKILREYINKMESGLFILDAPTGFGKTRTVVEYIKEILDSDDKEIERIFFVTNLKLNLPIKEFIESEYKKYCLVLKPNYQNVIDEWGKESIEDQAILNSEEYKNLSNFISAFYKSNSDKKLLKSIEEMIERTYEPKFRELIKKNYFYNKSQKEKNKNIENNSWIKSLYPSIEIKKYRVILLTTNKFVSPLDPLYKTPYYLYEDKIMENSILFIDEFDATKNVILDSIIYEGLKSKIDIIKLFTHIYYALEKNEIPAIILNLEKSNKDNEEFYYSASEILEENKKKFKEIYDKYKLNYLIKTKNINDDKSFLFNDGNYVSITKNNQRKNLVSKIDEEEFIRTVYTSISNEGEMIQQLIKEVEETINYFVNGMKWIALDYEFYKNKVSQNNRNENYMTFDESIRSILSLFNLEEKEVNYLLEIIKLSKARKELNVVYDKEDGFNKTGLEIIEIEDSDFHNLQSVFHKFKFKIVPEEIICLLAKQVKIIGISATGSMDTVLANYDLNYLKKKLKEKFYILDEDNFQRMKKDFLETQKIYNNKVNINVDVIDNYAILDRKEICENIIKNIFVASKRKEYLDKLNESIDLYYYSLMLKIGHAYKEFIENDNLYSFVCFLNGLPRFDGGKGVKIHDLQKMFDDISLKDCNIYYVSSSNFEEEMLKFYNKLSNKEKCFVLTTYNTLGAGKNIQYKIPDGIENNMIIINRYRWEKDFDGILLIAPTYLIQNLDNNSKDKYFDVSKFIFQQEYLYKRHKNYSLLMKNIIFGFKKIFFNESFAPIDYRNVDLYMHNARIIIQAVGRICRSPNKNKEILIVTEKEVVERLNVVKEELDNRLLNKEFRSLLDIKINKPLFDIGKFNLKNTAAKWSINQKAWTLRSSCEKKKEWIKIRDLVLKNPTYSGEIKDIDKFYYDFKFPLNRYSYIIEGKSIKDINFDIRVDYKQVSASAAELERFMDIKCVEKHFKDKGYATYFKKNNKIMLPSLFKQIYLGALGEVAGKSILENYLNINLEDVEDYALYELFDYKLGNIYIDFKHWETFITDNEEQVKKITRKLNRVKGSKAIIINIIKRANFKSCNINLPKNIIQVPWIVDYENKVDYSQIMNIKEFLIKE